MKLICKDGHTLKVFDYARRHGITAEGEIFYGDCPFKKEDGSGCYKLLFAFESLTKGKETMKIESLKHDFDFVAQVEHLTDTVNQLIQNQERLEEAIRYLADFCGQEDSLEPSKGVLKILDK